MPEVNVDVRDGLASINIDDLDIEVDRNTLLAFSHILTDELAINNYKAASSAGFNPQTNQENAR